MKVLFDIGHPAHVHFFRHPIELLQQHNHEIVITSRKKEFATDLLEQFDLPHYSLSSLGGGGLVSLGMELIKRNTGLYKVIQKQRPNIMAAIGGVSIAQVGRLTRIPSLVFYDTENAKLQNAITYPFASRVIVPRCYETWVPKHRNLRYDGYHELSYLHPHYFKPDRDCAIRNGLAPQGDTFFLRVVSWQANHDIGETGWNRELLLQLTTKLSRLGKVLISSETPLDNELQQYAYTGAVSDVHHLLAFSRAFIGESATMASEAAVLGVPAIYAAETGRGYTNEQEQRYQLVKNIRQLSWSLLNETIDELLSRPSEFWQQARQTLLNETIDVASFVTDCIESYPSTAQTFHPGH